MKSKIKVVRIKSSDSICRNDIPKNMKSRSNTTFLTNTAKTRGVYVERKPPNRPVNETEDKETLQDPVKAPKRPSRGQKVFLDSVLSLLSKSSTGTQHPDIPDNKPKAKKTMNPINSKDPDRRKKKYKSRVLNSCNYPPDTFEVLQHKKNILMTPSIGVSEYEEIEDINWAEFLPRLVKPDSEEIQLEKDKKLSHLVKEVNEGRMDKEKRVRIEVDEPPTLVSENIKNTTKDPKFYNFFVDLLETTFSVYNIKSEINDHNADRTPGSSKVAFEMDETVADMLKVKPEISRQISAYSKYTEEPKKEHLADYFQLCPPRQFKKPLRNNKPTIVFQKQRLKNQQFFPKSASMRSPLVPKQGSTQKSFQKKNSKQILLSMLKEQLRMDNQPLEEPQNLFQALKVIAKNKRKSQKSLRFEKIPTMITESLFRTRRLIPKRSKQKGHSQKFLSSPKSSMMKRQQKKSINTEDKISNHSLEVFNINYDKYSRLTKPKSTAVESYSPNFSPTESINDLDGKGKPYIPLHNRVIMTVKPILPKSSSRSFCFNIEEAML